MVIDSDQAQFLDPAQQVDPASVATITTDDHQDAIVAGPGTEVLTVDPGADETLTRSGWPNSPSAVCCGAASSRRSRSVSCGT
jgi:hypothetical protein